MKKKLFVIEGFDRAGKDTLLNDLSKIDIQNTYIYFNDLNGLPKYDKEQDDFLEWLNKFINNQINELIELFKKYDNIIMTRLLLSDEVYSELFNREHTTIKYIDKLKDIEIINYCLLFINFEEYVKRIEILNSDIQYNKNMFNKINKLYQDKIKNLNGFIKYVKAKDKPQDILNDFLSSYKIFI